MTLVGTLKNIVYIALFIILLPLIPLMIGGIQQLYNRYIDPRSQVGVLPIKGILYDSNYYTKQLNRFFKDDAIKAVLIKIECPGSAAGTGQAIYNELMELKKVYEKPVIVLVENVCASGGYYIASAADHIVASPMALIGSIGVAMPYFFNLKEFTEYYKIKYVPLAAGEFKNSTNPFTEITPQQKKMLQSVIDDSYEQFAIDIAERRNLSLDTKNVWANGKIFNGRQALKLGLIDELGSMTQATQAIKQKTNITGDIKWIHAPSKTGIWTLLGGESDDEQTAVSALANECITIVENRFNNHIVQ
jgi:protease IV